MGSIVKIEGYEGKQLNEEVQQNSMKQKWETKSNILWQYALDCVFKKLKESKSFIDTVEQLQLGKKIFCQK